MTRPAIRRHKAAVDATLDQAVGRDRWRAFARQAL
jgi:hypothetical protein